jgi:lipopolysaccharide transport system ATP-binding protein
MVAAIEVQDISKRYRIAHQNVRGGYRTLRESIMDLAMAPIRRLRGCSSDSATEDFWALKNISFSVAAGTVLGIIGRNGVGKSTLLKILSRITKPTSGVARLRGRVGSLLEVGTGFHPELTGRENIFLNGGILGMSRREIVRKFDAIVDFAGIEPFLDTPVKRYSSGMYVRLGFAVASHLDLEILVVDEVLAVGDLAFQKKCLGKMKDVTQSGRTVLFVSHNMAAIRSLCDRGIVLEDGCMRLIGDVDSATNFYLRSQTHTESGVAAGLLPCLSRCHDLLLKTAELATNKGDLVVRLTLEARRRFPVLGVGFAIRTLEGSLLASQGPMVHGMHLQDVAGTVDVSVTIHDFFQLLNGGAYLIDVWLAHPGVEILIKIEGLLRVEVPEQDPYGSGHALTQHQNGPCCLISKFTDQRP